MLRLSELKLRGNLTLNKSGSPTIWWVSPTKTLGPYGSMYRPSKTVNIALKAETTTGLPIIYTFESGILPAGLTVNPGGTITGTITGADGVYTFVVKAASASVSITKQLRMVVGEVPAPVWVTPSGILDAMAYTNMPFTYNLLAEDELDLPVFYTLVGGSLPPGLFLNTDTGEIYGTPINVEIDQIYTFIVSASNLSSAATRQFALYLTVVPPEYAPKWITPAGNLGNTAIETLFWDAQLLAADPGSLPIEYVILAGSLPDGILIENTTGYTSGIAPMVPDTTTYTVIAGARTDLYTTPRLFKIRVEYVQIPTFDGVVGGALDLGTYLENTTLTTTQIVSSTYTPIPYTYTVSGLEDYPEIVYNTVTNELSGTMSPYPVDAEEPQFFPIDFTISATNGIKSADLAVLITNEKDLPPVFNGNTVLFQDLGNTTLVGIPEPIAQDPNGKPLIYTVTPLPSEITFDYSDGTFVGKLPPANNGADVITNVTVTAFDGVHTSSRDYQFVSWLNTPPIFDTPAINLGNVVEGFSFTFTIEAHDPQFKPIIYTLSNSAINTTIDPFSGVVSGEAWYLTTPGANTETCYFTVDATDGVLSTSQEYFFTIEKDLMPEWITPAGNLGTHLGMVEFNHTFVGTSKNTNQGLVYYIADRGNLPVFSELILTGNGISGKFPNDANNSPNWEETYTFDIGIYDVDNGGVEVPNHRVVRTFSITNKYNNAPVWRDTIDNTTLGSDYSAAPITPGPSPVSTPVWQSPSVLGTTAGHFGLAEDVTLMIYASNATSYFLNSNTSSELAKSGLDFFGHQDDYYATLADPTQSPVYHQIYTMLLDDPMTNVAIIAGSVKKNPTNDAEYFTSEHKFYVTAQNPAGVAEKPFTYHIDNIIVLASGWEQTPIGYAFANAAFEPYVEAVDLDGQIVEYFYSESSSILYESNSNRIMIDQGAGRIYGTYPQVAQDQIIEFTLQAYDHSESITEGFYYKTPMSFRVIARFLQAPIWQGPSSFGRVQNMYFTTQLQAVGAGNAPSINYTVVGGVLPPNFTLSSTGKLSGIAETVDEDTVYTFTIRASNTIRYTDREFTFTVYKNVTPTWTTIDQSTGNFYQNNGNNVIQTGVVFNDLNGVYGSGFTPKIVLTDRSGSPENIAFGLYKGEYIHQYIPFDGDFNGVEVDVYAPNLPAANMITTGSLTPSRALTPADFDSGKFGNGAILDGTLWGYHEVTRVQGFENYGIECFVKPTSNSGVQTLFKCGNMECFYANDRFVLTDGPSQIMSNIIRVGEWYHVSIINHNPGATGSNTNYSMAIDGMYIGTIVSTYPVFSGTTNAVIGAGSVAGNNPFHGVIDEYVFTKNDTWMLPSTPPNIEADRFFYDITHHADFNNNVNNQGTGANTLTTHGVVSYVSQGNGNYALNFNNLWVSGDVSLQEEFTIEIVVGTYDATDCTLFTYGDADGFKLKRVNNELIFESKGVVTLSAPVLLAGANSIVLSKSEKNTYLVINNQIVDEIYTNPRVTYTGNSFTLGSDIGGTNKLFGLVDSFTITNGVSKFRKSFQPYDNPRSDLITGQVKGFFPLEQNDTVYTFKATVSDHLATSEERTFSMLNLKDVDPYFNTNPNLGEWIERYSVATGVSAGDVERYPVVYSIVGGNFPSSLTFDTTTGGISGTAPLVNGSLTRYEFTVQADDSNHVTTRDFFIDVEEDYVPVWQTPNSVTLAQVFGGDSFSATVQATDQNLSQTLVYANAGGSWPPDSTVSTGGQISGTIPVSAVTANYSPIISVTDGNAVVNSTFLIEVIQNQPPVFQTPGYTIFDSWEQTIQLDSDTDSPIVINIVEPNNTTMTLDIASPDWVVISNVINANGLSQIYISNVTFPAVENDTEFYLDVTADDSVLSASERYTFKVKFNSAPIWQNAAYLGEVQESSAFMKTMVATSNGLPVYYSIDSTDMVDVHIDAISGMLTWVSPPVFVDTVYSVTLNASTGIKFTKQTFTIMVRRNWPPVWQTGSNLGTYLENRAVNFTLLATDPNGHQVNYSPSAGTTIPPFLTANYAAAGNTATFDGVTQFVGNDTVYSFTIGALDDYHLVEREFTFTVLYTPAPQWITPAGHLGNLVENEPVNIQIQATSNAAFLPLTYSTVGSWPNNLTLLSNGVISGSVQSGLYANGTVLTLTARVEDIDGRANTRTFTANVVAADMMTVTSPTGVVTTYKANSKIIMNAAGEWKLRAHQNLSFPTKLWGGGGGGWHGGVGGFANGTVTVTANTAMTVWVGGGGVTGTFSLGRQGGFGGGGYCGPSYGPGYFAGSGGGLSGIFISNSTPIQANAIIIAAGGGGAIDVDGGNGGGLTGVAGGFRNGQQLQGGGGTQLAGGTASTAAGATPTPGGALYGGNGAVNISSRSGGGGGGGYFGGGGGGSGSGSQVSAGSGGGGGSSYIASPYLSNGTTVIGVGYVPPMTSDVDYISNAAASGAYMGVTGNGNGIVSANGLVVIIIP
jgi:hypothetical protein